MHDNLDPLTARGLDTAVNLAAKTHMVSATMVLLINRASQDPERRVTTKGLREEKAAQKLVSLGLADPVGPLQIRVR